MEERGLTDNQGRMDQDNRGMNSINNPQQGDMSRMRNETSDTHRQAGADRQDDAPGRSESNERRTSNRGFAAMDPEKQKRIASEGGRAAHRQGVAHEWSRDEARQAGRKGGQIVSQNREHMSEIGRKGGQSSGQRRQRNSADRNEES